jgi:hypothetical protein
VFLCGVASRFGLVIGTSPPLFRTEKLVAKTWMFSTRLTVCRLEITDRENALCGLPVVDETFDPEQIHSISVDISALLFHTVRPKTKM